MLLLANGREHTGCSYNSVHHKATYLDIVGETT